MSTSSPEPVEPPDAQAPEPVPSADAPTAERPSEPARPIEPAGPNQDPSAEPAGPNQDPSAEPAGPNQDPSAAPAEPLQDAPAAPAASHDDAAVVRARDVADPSRVRRAPRYGRFAALGLLAGALVSFVLTLVPVAEYELTQLDLFFLLFLGLGTAGVLAGLAVALLVDRRSLRKGARRAERRGRG